jgi:hypothetical protein
MNRVYALKLAVYVCIALIPRMGLGQCNCVGKDSLTQYVTIDTANGPKALITFNKYIDPTGQMYLACMEVTDTISIVSSTLVRNQSTGPIIGANFTISVTSKITGPGSINSSKSGSSDYGPYDFGPAGSITLPSDSVVLGPDTLLNKKVNTVSVSNPAPYIGTGTISDTLIFGGGAFSDAGTSFDYSIRTKYWGSAKITFFLCPNVPLATTIENLTATQQGDKILIQWLTENQQNNIRYEIQTSTDGRQFQDAGEVSGNLTSEGSATKYLYQYNLDQTDASTVYFRVKQTDADGKVSYSGILTVKTGISTSNQPTYQAYPNPATTTVAFRFNTPQTGRFRMELVSTSGQVIRQKTVSLSGTYGISMDLDVRPARGLYFLRTVDQTHEKQYIGKIFIN